MDPNSECCFDWIVPPNLGRVNLIQTQLSSDPFGGVDSIHSKKQQSLLNSWQVKTFVFHLSFIVFYNSDLWKMCLFFGWFLHCVVCKICNLLIFSANQTNEDVDNLSSDENELFDDAQLTEQQKTQFQQVLMDLYYYFDPIQVYGVGLKTVLSWSWGWISAVAVLCRGQNIITSQQQLNMNT